jgi:hypothetical protein
VVSWCTQMHSWQLNVLVSVQQLHVCYVLWWSPGGACDHVQLGTACLECVLLNEKDFYLAGAGCLPVLLRDSNCWFRSEEVKCGRQYAGTVLRLCMP